MKTISKILCLLLTVACWCFSQTAQAVYDPTSGRFMSFDTAEFNAGRDGYSFCNGDPINIYDPDGRFGKGFNQGWIDGRSPGGSSGTFNFGFMLGGILGGGAEGVKGGAAIEANTFTFGQINGLNTYANGLQGGAYDFTRGASYVAMGSLTLAGGAALYANPAVFNASLTAAYSPWTPVAVGAAAGGYMAYSDGGSPGNVLLSAATSGAFVYASSPFPISGNNAPPTLTGIQANKATGDAWEAELLNNQLPLTQNNIRPQITIQSAGPSGLNVRLDAVGTDVGTGAVVLTDAKASASAPLTPNQTIVYPELPVYGGTVVGAGKPPYVGGTVIPPTPVTIIRKP